MKTPHDLKTNPVVETKIKEEQLGAGFLRIHESWVNGELATSVFTLESLAHVLDIPMSTMEGRYKRAKLQKWMVPVRSMAGRPLRGFPYALLEHVIDAVQNPWAQVVADGNGSTLEHKQRQQVAELEPTYYLGERYYTIPALARTFDYSETTVRHKLKEAGLMRYFKNLNLSAHGGRPKRGIPERYLGQVKLAVTENANFKDAYESVMYQTTGMLAQAKAQMKERIAPHRPPAPGSLQAWDSAALAPAQPVVKTHEQDDFDAEIEALGQELNSLVIPPAKSNDDTGNTPTTTQHVQVKAPRSGADEMPQFDSMPTDAQADRAQREQEAATRRAMVPVQRQMLIDDVDEPTDEDLSDTCYALDLKGAEAKAFIESVREGRRNKWNDQATA